MRWRREDVIQFGIPHLSVGAVNIRNNHSIHDASTLANEVDSVDSNVAATAVFLIQKMNCPTEENLIRDRLEGVAGIEDLRFNLVS